MSIEQTVVEKLRVLPPDQQQQVLDFVEALLFQSSTVEFKHPDGTPMSASEAAAEWAGCLDGGPADLSINKRYLEELGTS